MGSVIKINPEALASQVGFGIKTGNIITPDMITNGNNVTDSNGYLVTFKLLHIGAGGDLVIRGVDGNLYPVRGVLSGAWVPAWGSAIVASGTFNGVLVNTTATNIDWYSGM